MRAYYDIAAIITLKNYGTRANTITLFMATIVALPYLARVLASSIHFHPSLRFVGNARANMRASYDMATIITLKYYSTGVSTIKLFTATIVFLL